MAEIRCPECGKTNPEESSECQFCQAPLKPLAAIPGPGDGTEMPDWLSGLRSEDADTFISELQPEEPGAAKEVELPDWLASLKSQAEEPAEVAPEEGEGSQERTSLPDWLQPADVPSIQGEPLPDWLSSAMGEGAEEPEWQAEAAAPTEQGLPDWLADLKANVASATGELKIPEAQTPPEFAATVEPGNQPDWLTGMTPEEPGMEQPVAEAPDWLAQPQPESLPIIPESEPGQVPLGELTAEPPQPNEEMPASGADAPDWLAGISGQRLESPFQAEEGDAGKVAPFEDSEPPDWLKHIDLSSSEKPASSVPAFSLDEEEAAELAGLDEQAGEAPYLATLPDWVSQVSAETAAPRDAEVESEAGLAPAELPGWLEAMRPVEAAAPTAPVEDLSGTKVEAAGPLAGLRGVLTADAGVIRPRKPTAYSVKLRVTEEQQARVALLGELLAGEQKPKAIPAQPILTPLNIFRLLIALVMILSLLWVVMTGGREMAVPAADSSPGVMDLYRWVEALPAGAPVLLAFDFEPGFAGEMDMAGSAVIAHLKRQGAYLALVSTSPTGPALAELFIASDPDQTRYAAFANLGYIPGGPMGIVSLAQQPRQTMPYTLGGVDVWSSPPLNGVTTLADFSLLVVFTDDPDTARSWIEQVEPTLRASSTPLVMVTSAQAEPLVRPYYEGLPRQLSGLVAGIRGGAAYEGALGTPGVARESWDAFSVGLLVSALVIIIGALVGFVSNTLISSMNKNKREQP